MHNKPSSTPSLQLNESLQGSSIQPNHRKLKHAFYAAGASAALSLLVMTGCACSNQDALETIPDTGATAVQTNPNNQATPQSNPQDTTQHSESVQNTTQGSTIEDIQAEADARVKAAEDAQKKAEESEAQLQQELEAAQKAQADAEAAAQTANDEKDALQKELELAQQSQATAETDAQTFLDEKEAASADIEALLADNEKLTADLQTAQASQAKAEDDAKAAQEAQAKAEEDTKIAKEAQTEAEADLAQVQEELTSTTAQLKKAQEAIQAVEENAKSDADELAAAVEAQKKAENDLAQAQEDLKSALAAKDAAEAEANQAKEENTSLASANAAAEEARAQAEEEAAVAKAAQAEAEAKVEAGLASAADVEAAQAAQAKAEAEAQAAKDAQAAAESENQKLQDEKTALEAELSALKASDSSNPAEPAPEDGTTSPDGQIPDEELNVPPESSPSDKPSEVDIPNAPSALRPSRFDVDNYSAYGMAVRPSLAAYSWNELSHIASFIEAHAVSREEAIELAKTFNLVNGDGTFTGETKSITLTDGQTIDVLLIDIFHDYTELDEPTAFTFMLAENYANQPMNESGTNEGGWELSDMRYWLNSEVFDKLPDSLYYSIKPVQKLTNNIGNSDSPESVYGTTDLLFLFSWVECLGPLSWNEGTELAYIDAVNNAEGFQYAWFTQQGIAGDQNNPALIRSDRSALPANEPLEETNENEEMTAEQSLDTEAVNSEEISSTSQDITWWMRSSDPSSTTNYGDMGPEMENGSVASNPEGVVFGFCL